MTNFKVEITSDNVCPWCYVGHKKLQSAIAAWRESHPGDSFTTTWRPFYLNPDAPKTGIDKRGYYASKFGPQRAEMIIERLTGVGKEVGIAFSFGGKTGNTRDSHRLLQLAKTKGGEVQTKTVQQLFSAYFENEQDVTDKAVLVEAGVKAGLDKAEVEKWLDSDKGGKEVDKEVMEAQLRGVSGVPDFVIQDRYEIGGAQDKEAFLSIFERVKKAEERDA